MAKLFNVAENNITYHLKNIFKTKELEDGRKLMMIEKIYMLLCNHSSFLIERR